MRNYGIVGSRHPSKESLERLRQYLDSQQDINCIVSGGAFGADTFAMWYAVQHKKALLVFEPRGYHNVDTCNICNKQGVGTFIDTGLDFKGRNTLIVENSDIIVCPDYGNGTIDTMEKALAKGIEVIVLGKYIPGKYNKITPSGVHFI